jgi:hypothetical protein
MSWKFVFNCNQFSIGRSMDQWLPIVKEAGYKFFCFNGRVYDLNSDWTGIRYEDLI